MTESVTVMTIEIPHPPEGADETFITALSQLFDAIADRVFLWSEGKFVDPMVTAVTKDADWEMPSKTQGVPEFTPTREADRESNES